MRRVSVLVGAVVVATITACTPTKLLKATAQFSTTTVAATAELRAAPGILSELCRDRIELDYFEHRLIPGQAVAPLAEFREAPIPTVGGHTTTSWKIRCDGLARADQAFLRGLSALEQYSAALGGFADKDLVTKDELDKLAASFADDAQKLREDAAPYHDALAGLSAPVAAIAQAVEGNWKGRKLRGLVHRTNPSVHDLVEQLEEFIRVVRRGYLRDTRLALHDVVELAQGLRRAEDLSTVVSGTRMEIEMTRELDALDARLELLYSLLETIAVAHSELDAGWEKGEDSGLSTLKTIALFSRDVYSSVKAFRTAGRTE